MAMPPAMTDVWGSMGLGSNLGGGGELAGYVLCAITALFLLPVF